MAEVNGLITSLEQSLIQTKKALNILHERRVEFQEQPNTPLEEIEQNKAEIFALENMVKQTETAISSLSSRMQTGGFDEFDIDVGLK